MAVTDGRSPCFWGVMSQSTSQLILGASLREMRHKDVPLARARSDHLATFGFNNWATRSARPPFRSSRPAPPRISGTLSMRPNQGVRLHDRQETASVQQPDKPTSVIHIASSARGGFIDAQSITPTAFGGTGSPQRVEHGIARRATPAARGCRRRNGQFRLRCGTGTGPCLSCEPKPGGL
jgi:hypothetical protein